MKQIWSPWRMDYISSSKNESECVFCNALRESDASNSLIAYRGTRVFAILNRYPYTSGHMMIVPNQHVGFLEDLDAETRAEMFETANHAILIMRKIYQPEGFNLGINIGKAAGAGIADHVHMHVVPRWMGDNNFMATVGDIRVIPEALEDTLQRISEAWS